MNLQTEYETYLVCNPQWDLEGLLGNTAPPKSNEPKQISNDQDLLWWFVHVYIPPHPKDAEQWDTMTPPERLRWLFDYGAKLRDAQVRDVADMHPGFKNGLTFQEHFPGKSVETLLRYERDVRKIRNPPRSAPHNAAHIGEVSASKGSTKIQQTPRDGAVERLRNAAAAVHQDNPADLEMDTVDALNSLPKDLELLGLSPVATYSEGLQLLADLPNG